jgi:hypothetical protein
VKKYLAASVAVAAIVAPLGFATSAAAQTIPNPPYVLQSGPLTVGASGAGHYFWETAPGVYTADKTGTLAAAGDPWFVSVTVEHGSYVIATDYQTAVTVLIPEADATSRQLSLANANQ